MTLIRRPAVAGAFYPAVPRELEHAVETYLNRAKPSGRPPRAGAQLGRQIMTLEKSLASFLFTVCKETGIPATELLDEAVQDWKKAKGQGYLRPWNRLSRTPIPPPSHS